MEELHENIEEICSSGDIHSICSRLTDLLLSESQTKDELLSTLGAFGFDKADGSDQFIQTEYAEEFIYAFEAYVENLQFYPIPMDDGGLTEGTHDTIENILRCDNIHTIRDRLIDLLWTESQTTDGCNHYVKTEYAKEFINAFETYVRNNFHNIGALLFETQVEDIQPSGKKMGEGYFSPRSTDNKQTNPLHSTKPRR